MLGICQQVAASPQSERHRPKPIFLERDEIEALLKHVPRNGRHALRDRALLLLLYNTGARVQEVSDLGVGHLSLGDGAALVRLHGKGDKWGTCPLWRQTNALLTELLEPLGAAVAADMPVLRAANGHALTRFGIYKIVRRHAAQFDDAHVGRRASPHLFRHTAAVHMLEAGVEVNVIRGWLDHSDLTTTNRYAEITTRAKLEALRNTEPPTTSEESRPRAIWRNDQAMLDWLASL